MNIGAARLGDVAKLNPPTPRGLLASDTEVAVVPMAAVSEQGSMRVQEYKPANAVNAGLSYFADGDVLVAKITPCYENNKITQASIDREHAFGSTEFHVLRPQAGRLDGRYLTHFLRQDAVREAGVRRMTGSGGQRRVPRNFLEEIEIPLPPIDEQRRIAAILDQADALRLKRREALSLLKKLPHSIFARRFGSCLDNPRLFTTCKMADIIDFVGGTQPPKSTFLYEDGPDRVRFIQTRDFRTDQYKTYLPTSLAKRPFTEKDVIIGRYGPPVFQIFRGLAGTYNVALIKAVPKNGILEDFIFYLLQEEKLQNFVIANSVRTAGQSGVNLELLNNCPAYAPTTEEQILFSSEVENINNMINTQEVGMTRADALFASLQHRAFRGEL